mgnify:CR=1 FL=1|tara:strand:+ start:245 stop:1336 length:1092 start_codon:yes stop_codon:yes gene_type:complete
MGFFKNLQGSTAAPRLQNQQFGEVERIERMPSPPQPVPAPLQPVQPRPSLVVGGPAFFTPEGYQAPVQPEQAFMPTDRRPDPIGDNFSRPYERPIMPMPMPRPIDVPQDRAPVVPIEQPRETLPVDPGPVRPMPMPEPTPQPKYDPYAPSEMGARIAAGASAYRIEGDPRSGYLMNIYWIDDEGRVGNTTEGWSRVPKQFRNKVYRTKEEAKEAGEKLREYQDTGGATSSTPRRTPVTKRAPVVEAPVFAGGPSGAKTMPENIPAVQPDSLLPMPSPIDMEAVKASLAEYGITPKIPSVPAPVVPPTIPQTMPSMPSLPSRLMGLNIPLPTLPTLGGRPNLTSSSSRTLPGSKENLIGLREQR